MSALNKPNSTGVRMFLAADSNIARCASVLLTERNMEIASFALPPVSIASSQPSADSNRPDIATI
jgi:hypothetical protein